MSKAHSELLDRAAAAVSGLRAVYCRLFRNETGLGVTGRIIEITKPTTVTLQRGDFVVRNGHRVKYGLLNGGGDLIGYTLVEIGPQHMGLRLPVFTSAEGKVGADRLRPEQVRWDTAIRQAGGFSVLFRSPEELTIGILRAAGAEAGQSAQVGRNPGSRSERPTP